MSQNQEKFYHTFDATFWISITATVFGFCGLALRACLQSRCTKIACCAKSSIVSCDREPIADRFVNIEPTREVSLKLEEGSNN